MDFGSVLLTVPGVGMLAYSSNKLNISINLWNTIGYLILLLLMLLLMYDLMVIIRSVAFWLIRIDSLSELENELVSFSFKVPGVAFKGMTKFFFYIILPYGLMATIPTEFFTGILSGRYWIIVIGVCILFTFFCQGIWRLGLKHYSSASS